MTVFALVGQKRSGKDTIGKILMEKGNFVRYAYADPVRETVKSIFGWDDSFFEGEKKEQKDPFWGFTPRYALQFIGTDLIRNNVAKDVWIKRLHFFLMNKNDESNVVITDLRFPNEFQDVISLERQARFGVTKTVTIGVSRKLSLKDSHESESYIPELLEQTEHLIDNNGSREELEKNVLNIMEYHNVIGGNV